MWDTRSYSSSTHARSYPKIPDPESSVKRSRRLTNLRRPTRRTTGSRIRSARPCRRLCARSTDCEPLLGRYRNARGAHDRSWERVARQADFSTRRYAKGQRVDKVALRSGLLWYGDAVHSVKPKHAGRVVLSPDCWASGLQVTPGVGMRRYGLPASSSRQAAEGVFRHMRGWLVRNRQEWQSGWRC